MRRLGRIAPAGLPGALVTKMVDQAVVAALERVIGNLQSITQTHGAFTDPRGVYLEIALGVHELEAAMALMRRNRIV